jgi:peptide/nickel transport system substrate-binding protein
MTLSRRNFLATAFATFAVGSANAMGRLPYGGRLRLALPFALQRIDPHDARDPVSALLASAMFDPPFALDSGGVPYPTLAAGPIEVLPSGLGLRLRPGLEDANGVALTVRDLEFSLARARNGAAGVLLRSFGTPVRSKKEPDLLVFPRGTERSLSLALASPLVALVRRGFDPAKPVGTGAFAATLNDGKLSLLRNAHAARGAALLDAVDVDSVGDLAEALRRFEAEASDIGWLGRGLHRIRSGSEMFRSSSLGWLLLRSGKRLGNWGAPGAAQKLLSGIEPSRLERFGVRLPPLQADQSAYAGPSAELLVRRDAPHLLELGEALAQMLSASGAVRVRPEERASAESKIDSGDFDLALDFVRAFGPTREQQYLSLVSVANPSLLASAPTPPAELDRTGLALHATQATRTAILSEFAVVAGRSSAFRGIDAWDLGAVYKL